MQGIVGAGVPLTYTAGPAVCGTGVTTDSSVTVQRAFEPATPLFPLLAMAGGRSSGTVTIRAIGVMSCLG
ncbi:hypothetical protein Ade02nite_37240 [Paractinoplanes deccanensis]|uniref:Uncharacterized protein n=1 Tax=Paractinoplanes deccanensis TaxID=113561 RepID=A0ABQ3Y521_9ACTN|nr:hypothetical protein [Actinoplanes deccanensis]GID75083.1 hypothetical protein Ade02nite_37240 [Actinoplanes deccanensis]